MIYAIIRGEVVSWRIKVEKMDQEFDNRLARDYLDQALNHVSDGVAIFDADDCLVACNENYKSLYGNRLGVVMPGATFCIPPLNTLTKRRKRNRP